MRELAVFANVYDTPYIHEFHKGLGKQFDLDFEIVYYTHDKLNSALERALDEYEFILFLDIDDIPQPALISTAKQDMELWEIMGYGMRLFGEETGLFGRANYTNEDSEWYCHGFGNTMYSSRILKELMPLATDLDTIIRAGRIDVPGFNDLPLIHYRQYGQNSRLMRYKERWVWRAD